MAEKCHAPWGLPRAWFSGVRSWVLGVVFRSCRHGVSDQVVSDEKGTVRTQGEPLPVSSRIRTVNSLMITDGGQLLLENLPKLDGGFVDHLAILHSQMVRRMPAQPIYQSVSIKESDLNLLFFRNDLAKQNRLVWWLRTWLVLRPLVSHLTNLK